MSDSPARNVEDRARDEVTIEPWLGALLLALFFAIVGVFLPMALRVWTVGLTALLLIVAVLLLVLRYFRQR